VKIVEVEGGAGIFFLQASAGAAQKSTGYATLVKTADETIRQYSK
jgi:hypothetical protein